MADITMCVTVGCPLAPTCYRKKAKPGMWQSYAQLGPATVETDTKGGTVEVAVVCPDFIEMAKDLGDGRHHQ